MSKHTPGPWHVGLEVIGTRNERGFTRHIVEKCWDDEQGEADHRLIAVAPDLLAALWGLVGQIEQSREGFGIYADSPSMTEALAEAHRVYAKATGETHE